MDIKDVQASESNKSTNVPKILEKVDAMSYIRTQIFQFPLTISNMLGV